MSKNHRLNDIFLLDRVGVSRETCEKLNIYYELLIDWNKKINLVSRKSMDSSWTRHFLDSAQLWLYAPTASKSWLDFGSGAGFPGLVIGIIAQELKPELDVLLVEKNRKKALFMKEVSKKLSLNVGIVCSKIEEIKPQRADIISSRAFGSLRLLIEIAYMHKNDRTIGLFPKGKKFANEIQESLIFWDFTVKKIRNLLDLDSSILKIGNIEIVQ